MTTIEGACVAGFGGVRAAFEANFADPATGDAGASLVVTLDGETVVDLWGGVADVTTGAAWNADTITNVWSTTKTMAALCVLVLADRGRLRLDAPVADVWPEFAANGKAGITTRQILGHSAGLPGWTDPITLEELFDQPVAAARLAAQAPWWEPGTVSGYHAVTQGTLLGELVRRVDGRTLGRFFAEELAAPCGADFHIGLADVHHHRVAPVIPPGERLGGGSPPGSVGARATAHPSIEAAMANEPAWRRAELPAVNGHGNARSIAAVHSVVACGGRARGVELLSEAGCDEIFTTVARGVDLGFGVPMWFGTGFGIVGPESPLCVSPRACFWGGWGGSLALIDRHRRCTVSYAMNRMLGGTTGDLRAVRAVLAAMQAVDRLGRGAPGS